MRDLKSVLFDVSIGRNLSWIILNRSSSFPNNADGVLTTIPGISFHPSPVKDIAKYQVVEKNGWVYLNTLDTVGHTYDVNLFSETAELERNDTAVFLEMNFNCYSRILSENSLDVMHIGFVHTFGNSKKPAPIEIYPPRMIAPHHYKTAYKYEAGEQSMASRVFDAKDLIIENEFYLPHTTVARVIFDEYVSTVITFALPISDNKSKLFVKTYRNFWKNKLGDVVSHNMMYNTMLQDKAIVENIDPRFMDGRFNMRFDKLQNTYASFYKKFIRDIDN
jgi:phenylpropionate dioxygenase-like ring-hydroxylating dioxygenase large terminal subunit